LGQAPAQSVVHHAGAPVGASQVGLAVTSFVRGGVHKVDLDDAAVRGQGVSESEVTCGPGRGRDEAGGAKAAGEDGR
ncbi:MAG TPA: hypothetical protein VFQ75_01565, partial [Candidatus Limnocylindrales bacterium]|nr:hypothetical protein [Candidatus Limnocylindrales bacterium]